MMNIMMWVNLLEQNKLNKTENSQHTLSNTELSDYEVIQQILAGNSNQYQVIMRKYNQRLYRIARSIVKDDGRALDVVQEAHIKAFQKLNSFEGETGFSAWLCVITRNEALMVLRKLKPENILPIDVNEFENVRGIDMNSLINNPDQPDSIVEKRQLRAQLNQQIDSLPEIFRTVFIMRGVEQLSINETAKILDIQAATVKTRYFRAKTMLQEQLTNQCRESAYEVGGKHCDKIVNHVLAYIQKHKL